MYKNPYEIRLCNLIGVSLGKCGNKKSRPYQRDEIVIRVTTQFYVWIAPEHLIRYAGHCLDTLSL